MSHEKSAENRTERACFFPRNAERALRIPATAGKPDDRFIPGFTHRIILLIRHAAAAGHPLSAGFFRASAAAAGRPSSGRCRGRNRILPLPAAIFTSPEITGIFYHNGYILSILYALKYIHVSIHARQKGIAVP